MTKFLSEKEATTKFGMLIGKGIGKFISKPIKNKIGKQWKRNSLLLKKHNVMSGGYKKW